MPDGCRPIVRGLRQKPLEKASEWPKRIPTADMEPIFAKLTDSGKCPLLVYMLWDTCNKNKTTDDVNAVFTKLYAHTRLSPLK